MNTTRLIFSGARILSQQQWLDDHALIVENKIIKAIIPADMIKHHLPAKQYHFSPDFVLVPGFIDLHIHGAQGKDVMDDSDLAFQTISQALAQEGVTGFLATTMTAPSEKIISILKKSAAIKNHLEGAALFGVHLEGPFIAPEKTGAQQIEFLQSPHADLIQQWQAASDNIIKLITLAPELPGSNELIQSLVKMGIIVSVGHTNATYDQTKKAIDAGCSHATHLFNAMRGIHQREPGAVTALLLSERVMTEIIVDGIHLHPAIVKLILQVKHKEHIVLVTDAMRAKCLGNGKYELGGQEVEVINERVTLANGTLAGSVLRMPQAIKNVMQFTGCSLSDAVMMASYHPASVLGLQNKKGSIAMGKDADLVVMNGELEVVLTVRGGREVHFRRSIHNSLA